MGLRLGLTVSLELGLGLGLQLELSLLFATIRSDIAKLEDAVSSFPHVSQLCILADVGLGLELGRNRFRFGLALTLRPELLGLRLG